MASLLTRPSGLSRRIFLKGATLADAPVIIGLPPLISMFNSTGTAYAAETRATVRAEAPIENRFVLWFNGNGIPERYWIPTETGANYELTSCLSPLARFRNDTHVITGLDYPAAAGRADPRSTKSLSARSVAIPFPLATDRSVAGVARRVHQQEYELGGPPNLPREDSLRVDEHLSDIRDLERTITNLPPQYRRVDPPEYDGDTKDWPHVAKIQSDLLAYALATRQTRVASYMLTKCQGLARFPWLGYTAARHHDYTHRHGLAPSADGLSGQRILRDICRWHVEEFAYLVAKLKSIPEGDGTCSTIAA